MFKKFNFDYDSDNDSLFLYNSSSKSKASVEFDDLVIDFNSKKELVGIEFLNATKFFDNLNEEVIDKSLLSKITDCKIDILPKNNFLVIKLFLSFGDKKLITPVIIPSVDDPSPALALES